VRRRDLASAATLPGAARSSTIQARRRMALYARPAGQDRPVARRCGPRTAMSSLTESTPPFLSLFAVGGLLLSDIVMTARLTSWNVRVRSGVGPPASCRVRGPGAGRQSSSPGRRAVFVRFCARCAASLMIVRSLSWLAGTGELWFASDASFLVVQLPVRHWLVQRLEFRMRPSYGRPSARTFQETAFA